MISNIFKRIFVLLFISSTLLAGGSFMDVERAEAAYWYNAWLDSDSEQSCEDAWSRLSSDPSIYWLYQNNLSQWPDSLDNNPTQLQFYITYYSVGGWGEQPNWPNTAKFSVFTANETIACNKYVNEVQLGLFGSMWEKVVSGINLLILIFTKAAYAILWLFMSASVSFLGAAYQIPGSIHGVWEIMLYIVNIFFILILAIAAFMNVLGVQLDTYAVKKILPKFIVIAITVNFSYALIVFIMNIAEIGYTLLPQLIFNVGSAINDDLKFTIGKILDLNSYMDISKIFLVDQDNLKTFSFTVQLCVGFFFIIMLIRPYATLTFILATRILALWALIITAPFAFLAYILPNTKSLWDKWWSGLLSVAFIPVKVFTLLSLIYVAVFTFRDELLLWANTVGNTVVSTADGLSWSTGYGVLDITGAIGWWFAEVAQWMKFMIPKDLLWVDLSSGDETLIGALVVTLIQFFIFYKGMSYVAETASKVEFIGKAGEMGSKVGKWAGSQALRSPITTWKAGKGAIGAAGKGIKGGYKIIQNKEGMKAALDEHIANDWAAIKDGDKHKELSKLSNKELKKQGYLVHEVNGRKQFINKQDITWGMVGEARKQQIKNSAAVNYVKNKFRKKEDFKEENLSDKQKEQIQKGGHAIDQVTGQAIHKVFDSFQKAIDKENFGKLDSKLKSKFEKTFDAKTGEDIYALKKGIELTAEEQGKVGDMQDIARYKFHKNEYMGSKMVRAGQGMLDSLSKEEFDSALQTGDLIQKKKETAPGETAKINSNELDFGSKEATKIKYNALDHYMKTEKWANTEQEKFIQEHLQENIRFDDQKGEWISHSVAEMEAKDLSETQIKLVQDALASVQRTHDQQVSEIDTDEGHGIDQAGTLTFANKSGFGVDQKTLEEQGFHIMEEQSRLLNETLEVARQAAKDGIEWNLAKLHKMIQDNILEEKDGKLRLTDVAIGSDKKSEYEKFLEEFSKSDENPLKKEIEEKIEKEIEKEIEKLRETSEELAEAFIEEEIKSLQNDLGDSLNSKFNTSVKNSTRDLYEFEMRQRSGYAGQTKKFNGFNNMLANRRDGKYIDVVESLGQATVGTAVDSAKKVGAGVSTVVGGPTQAASKVATDIFWDAINEIVAGSSIEDSFKKVGEYIVSGINDAKSKNQRASDTKLSKIFESTAKGILGKDIPWALQTEAADDLRNASKRLSDAADEIKMTFSRMGLPDQIKKIQEISIEAQKGDKYAQAQLAASMDLIKNFAKDINTKEMMDGTFDILNRIREEEIKGNFIATGKNVIEIAEGLGSGNAVLKGMVTDIHTQEYKAERMNYGKQKNFDNFDRDHLIEIVANDKDAMKKLMDQINRSIAEATTDIEREQLNIIKDNLNSNDNKDKARGILMATGGGDLHKIQSGPKPLGGNDGIFVNTTHEQYFKKRMNNVQEIIDSTDKTFEEKKSAVDGFLTDGGDWSLMKQGLSGNREVIEAQKKFKDRITRLERDPKVKADQKSKETKETIEHLQKEVEEWQRDIGEILGGINNDFIKSVKQGESELRENIGSLSSALQSKQTDIQRSLQESIDNWDNKWFQETISQLRVLKLDTSEIIRNIVSDYKIETVSEASDMGRLKKATWLKDYITDPDDLMAFETNIDDAITRIIQDDLHILKQTWAEKRLVQNSNGPEAQAKESIQGVLSKFPWYVKNHNDDIADLRATIINLKSQLEQVQMGQGTSSTGSPSPTGAPIEGLVDEHGNPYYS